MLCPSCKVESKSCGQESGICVLYDSKMQVVGTREDPEHKDKCCDCYDALMLGMTVEEVRENLDYAVEIYQAVFRYFKAAWMSQGFSARDIQSYETLVV